MARITVEDCLLKERNRFALVQLASKRAKQLLHGSKTSVTEGKGNKSVVVALREIAAGSVRFMTEDEKRIQREQAQREREARLVAEAEAAVSIPGPDSLFRNAADTNGDHVMQPETPQNGSSSEE